MKEIESETGLIGLLLGKKKSVSPFWILNDYILILVTQTNF